MEIWERRRDGVTILRPRADRLDSVSTPHLRAALHKHIEAGNTSLAIDLTDVEFMDSTGLAVLISALRRLEGRGDLALCGVCETIEALLRLTGMARVFPIFENGSDVRSRTDRPI